MAQIEQVLKNQDRKLHRARNVVALLCTDIKDVVPNPETYEHDMDLREEKEKQRAALIRLREISDLDQVFHKKVQDELSRMSLCIPPVSRLEARAISSRATRAASTIRSAAATSSSKGMYRPDTTGGHNSDSVLIMELAETSGRGQQGDRAKTAIPSIA